MDCDALSLTGEKRVIATSIHLLKQTLNDTGQYDTTLENIYNLFLQVENLLQNFDASSEHPATAAAIATYLSIQLANYRRTDVLIEMDEINNLFNYLNNYRLITNQAFTAIQTNSLQYSENGISTDMSTRIQGLDSRVTIDEQELHVLAAGMAGSDIMQSEQSLTQWIGTHARDQLLDSAFKASKFHEIFVSANEHSSTWNLPNYFLTNTQENNHSTSYSPSWYWALPAGLCTMRFVFKRRLWDPTHLPWVPFVDPWPAGDHYKISMNHVYECDQEHRGEASILIGKKGSPQQGTFRIKHIDSYDPNTTTTFGSDDPVHVTGTTTLFTVDSDSANFHVPLFVNGQNITPGGGSTTNIHHTHMNEQSQVVHLTRRHKHTHTHVHGGDHYETYIAPSRTVINRTNLHNINTFQEFTNQQTINRIYRSVKTIPNFTHTEFHQTVVRNDWVSIRNKPELAELIHAHPEYAAVTHLHSEYAPNAHHHDTSYASLAHHHDATYAALSHDHDGYAALTHNHDAVYASAAHNHDGVYATEVYIDNMIGQRASQVWVEAALGLKSNTDHNHDDRYNTKNEISTLLGDRITLAGLTFTLQNYATTASLANNVTTETTNYLKKVDVFSNSIRLGWKDNGDQNVLVPNLATFQTLMTRVDALELAVQTLQTQQTEGEVAMNTVTSIQNSIWAFTQNALTRLTVLES